MNRQTVKRLMTKGIVAYVAVFSLVMLVAMPAVAIVAANQVYSSSIKNGQVKTPDIRKRAVTGKKIAKNAVKSFHIKNGQVKSADVASVSDSKIRYSTKTRYYSISPVAFMPRTNNEPFTLGEDGAFLIGDYAVFYAPVQLPHGATVTNLLLSVRDSSTENGSARLLRIRKGAEDDTMAKVWSSGSVEASRDFNTSAITNPVIDNANFHYQVEIYFPDQTGGLYWAHGVIITYQVTGP